MAKAARGPDVRPSGSASTICSRCGAKQGARPPSRCVKCGRSMRGGVTGTMLYQWAASTDRVKISDEVKRGIVYPKFEAILKGTRLSQDDVLEVTGIPLRTLARRKKAGRFTQSESESLVRLGAAWARARDLFDGDEDAARAWLEAPNRALAGRSPLELLQTEPGGREVEELVGRLEHGVFS